MRITLVIQIYSLQNPIGLTYEKVYESSYVPRIGEKIRDALFAENKEIIDVIHDLSMNQCFVILTSKEVPNDRLNGHIQEVAGLHHWTIKK